MIRKYKWTIISIAFALFLLAILVTYVFSMSPGTPIIHYIPIGRSGNMYCEEGIPLPGISFDGQSVNLVCLSPQSGVAPVPLVYHIPANNTGILFCSAGHATAVIADDGESVSLTCLDNGNTFLPLVKTN